MANEIMAARAGGKSLTLAKMIERFKHQQVVAPPSVLAYPPLGPGDHITHYDDPVLHQQVSRIHRQGQPNNPTVHVSKVDLADIDHMRDAFLYGRSAHRAVLERAPDGPEQFGDAELIMEMIRRGYACMKLPADGGPPKVLRDAQPDSE